MSIISQSDSPASQVVARNIDHFSGKDLLIAGAIEDSFPKTLREVAGKVTVFSYNYGVKRYYDKIANIANYCDSQYQAETKHQVALIYIPKSKAETVFLLANIAEQLEEGALIFLVGENNGGIRSADKFLAPYGDICNKLDSARRCSLYVTSLTKPVQPFNIQDWVKKFSLNINGIDLTVCSLPGVFSHGQLDSGTDLLLKNLVRQPNGRVLDLGCGAGIIGCYLAKHYPEVAIEMVDISALAVTSSNMTRAENKLAGRAYLSDVYSDIGGKFNYIISNPPFHSGLKTHYASTETFLANANQYLEANGFLTIVANSFLKYPPILKAAFEHCQLAAKTTKFSVYYCEK